MYSPVQRFTGVYMKHELALLAALQRDISERLRPVCLDMSEETFQEIVRDIVAVIAESITSITVARRIFLKCSRTRSKMITDSFTE